MPDTITDDEALQRAAETLAGAKYAIALVGAGISVESGIPPFRGAGGLWTKHGEPPMDGYQRLLADPDAHWQSMIARRGGDDEFSRAIRDARPNAAHLALARLEKHRHAAAHDHAEHRQPAFRALAASP